MPTVRATPPAFRTSVREDAGHDREYQEDDGVQVQRFA